MEVRHRLKLKRNTQKLLEDLDAYYVLPYLFQESIISQRVWDEIVASQPKTPRTRTTELLRRLPKCGPKAYDVFCSALDKHNYGFLREALEKTVITEEDVENFKRFELQDITEHGSVHVTQISKNNVFTDNTPGLSGNLAVRSGQSGRVTQISTGNIYTDNTPGLSGNLAVQSGPSGRVTQISTGNVYSANYAGAENSGLVNITINTKK